MSNLQSNSTSSAPLELLQGLVRVLLVGIIVGGIASLLAIAFIELVKLLNHALFVAPQSREALQSNFPLTLLAVAVPAIAGLVVGLLMKYSHTPGPRSPGDVILAVQSKMIRQQLPTSHGIVNYFASIISLGAGASMGQYGPIVHMGATLGNALNKLARTEPNVAIGCGVAAGIATAFNAPIAGVLFAHEVILRHYSLRAFAPITIAASVGFYLSNHVFVYPPLFQLKQLEVLFAPEFFIFILIGIIGALVAVGFMRALFFAQAQVAKLNLPMTIKPMIAGLCIGIMALQIPEILGTGGSVLQGVVNGDSHSAGDLTWLLLAKIFATLLCVSFGFAGGVFSPSLLIGVLFGAIFGTLTDAIIPSHSAVGLYAICGMAAVTSPVIGAPLTTILIVFELTRSYELTTAVMASVVFSNLVAYRLFGRSLFDVQLKNRGYDLSFGHDQLILSTITLDRLLSPAETVVDQKTSLYDTRQAMTVNENTVAYVLNEEEQHQGSIALNSILALEDSMDIRVERVQGYLAKDELVFYTDTSVWEAMQQISNFVGESVPIVDRETKRLCGTIFETDLISAYIQYMQDERADENAGG